MLLLLLFQLNLEILCVNVIVVSDAHHIQEMNWFYDKVEPQILTSAKKIKKYMRYFKYDTVTSLKSNSRSLGREGWLGCPGVSFNSIFMLHCEFTDHCYGIRAVQYSPILIYLVP